MSWKDIIKYDAPSEYYAGDGHYFPQYFGNSDDDDEEEITRYVGVYANGQMFEVMDGAGSTDWKGNWNTGKPIESIEQEVKDEIESMWDEFDIVTVVFQPYQDGEDSLGSGHQEYTLQQAISAVKEWK